MNGSLTNLINSPAAPTHILCVDDHLDMGFLLQFVLQRHGYQVTLSGSVQNALIQLRSQTVDLLITDLTLPDGCGTTLCREVRQNRVYMPVIILSGSSDLESAEFKASVGADAYLMKPVNTDQIVKTVERLLKPPALPRLIDHTGVSHQPVNRNGNRCVMLSEATRCRKDVLPGASHQGGAL